MKFGSVKFFKTLILCGYALLVLIPVATACVLGNLYVKEKDRADSLEEVTLAEMAQLVNQSKVGEETPVFSFDELPTASAGLASFPYQSQYPHLYADRPLLQTAEEKVCYLTFDDGPSDVTLRILDTLAQEDVKATFFVTGRNSELSEDALKRAADEGHTIGVHTWSHDYETLYSSVEAYLEDFDKMYTRISEVTGQAPGIFRFPGGSINTYNQQVYTALVAEMTRRGFVFYDWNAAADDATVQSLSAQQVQSNVLSSAAGQDRLIVLMHDRRDNGSTAAALPGIIEALRGQGYRFEALTNEVQPITYFYNDGRE